MDELSKVSADQQDTCFPSPESLELMGASSCDGIFD